MSTFNQRINKSYPGEEDNNKMHMKSAEEIYLEVSGIEDDNSKVKRMSEYISRAQACAMAEERALYYHKKGKPEQLMDRTRDILYQFDDRMIIIFAGMLPLSNAKNLVNTFTCCDALSVLGFGVEYIPPQKREGGKPNEGEVVMRARNPRIPDVIGGPMARFVRGEEIHYVPIINKNINTNYFPDIEGIEFSTFSPGLAISVAAVCSYVEAKSGKSTAITITPAVNELMGLSRMIDIAGMNGALTGILERMRTVDKFNGVSREYTWRGARLASEIYNFLITEIVKADSTMLAEWVRYVNMAIVHPGKRRKFVTLDIGTSGQKVLKIDYLTPMLPHTIGGRSINLQSKSASLFQAWSALGSARSVRGENESERAVYSRYANVPIRVSYPANETMRVRADYEQFMAGASVIVIWSNITATVATTQLLCAALMTDFKGVIRVDSNLKKMQGMMTDLVEVEGKKASNNKTTKEVAYTGPDRELRYRYRDSKYEVTFYNLKGSLEDAVKGADLMLDVEVAANDSGNFESYNEGYAASVPIIMKKLDALKVRYVLPVKMYADIDSVLLVEKSGKTIPVRWVYSGAQFSNLMCYITNVKIEPWQEYDLNSFDGRATWLAATIIFQIARNTYNVTGVTPNFLLEDCGYPIVKNKVGGLGHITKNIHTYSYMHAGKLEEYTIEDLLEVIETTTDISLLAGATSEWGKRMRDEGAQAAEIEKEDRDTSKGKESVANGGGSSSTAPTVTRYEEVF